MLEKKLIGMLTLMFIIAVLFTSLNMAFYLIFVEPLFMLVLFGIVGMNKMSLVIAGVLFMSGVLYILTSPHRLNRILEMFS